MNNLFNLDQKLTKITLNNNFLNDTSFSNDFLLNEKIFYRIQIIAQMQILLDRILPPIFKNYVRIFNFSKQSVILHVLNGITSSKIRNLSGRISRQIWQQFKDFSNCQLEIYVYPQTILNFLQIDKQIQQDNQKNSQKSNQNNNNSNNSNNNDNLFSSKTLNELRNLSAKMNNLHPKLKAALEKVIEHKSQQSIKFL